LLPEVAAPLTRSLGVDLGPVRVHTDDRAAAATTALGARAFTWGSQVFLGRGEHAGDLGLLAHEVGHVVQQGGGPAIHLFDGPHGALEHEAHQFSAAVVRGEQATVVGRTSGPAVQGLLGWVRRGLSAVGEAISDIGGAVKDKVLAFVKDNARAIPGYDLLGFVLGRDPITQQAVERTPTNLVRGVLGLVPGGAAIFANLAQAQVVQRAYEWLAAELPRLGLTWPYIRGLFQQAWDALSATDFLSPGRAWDKLKNIFGPPLRRIRDFAAIAGRKVLEFVFEGALALGGSAGQQVLAIIRRAGAVFNMIVGDPVRFLGNLVSAVKGGFARFRDNILTHLRTGLFEWLMGALRGAVAFPAKWDFAGILGLVTQVLGLTYGALRGVMVKIMGEPAVATAEKAFAFVTNVATKGLSAAWEQIKEFASDLTDTVIGGIRDWIAKSVVGAAVAKLVTMFNPVGAIIQGIVTIYNTMMFFVERAQQIARLVGSVVDSVESIARGNVSAAVAYVERSMANALPVIIGFLARIVGLGNVTGHVREIIQKVRMKIAAALERIARWVADHVRGLVARADTSAKQGIARLWQGLRQKFTFGDEEHELIATPGDDPVLMIASDPKKARNVMDDEVRRAKAAGDQDRVKTARGLLIRVVDTQVKLRAGTKAKDENAVASAHAQFALLIGELRAYAANYRVRGLVPRAGEVTEGLILPYDKQPQGGGTEFEREHIVPGALIAAWMGLDRESPLIKRMYRQMVTLLWRAETADLKTKSDNSAWTAMIKKRDKWLADARVATVLAQEGEAKKGSPPPPLVPGSFDTLANITNDRVTASIIAARATHSTVTEAQIRAAATAQATQLSELVEMVIRNNREGKPDGNSS
jgi:hypothetical protein